MKNIMEHMVTILILTIIMFAFTSFQLYELQIENARNIHTSAINQIQSSYYTIDMDEMNTQLQEKYGDDWNITYTVVNSTPSRQDWEVVLNYAVYMPIFNFTQHGTIRGYAR